MSGTIEGGRKARDTNYSKHGRSFYKRIGSMGGKNGHTGGFASNHDLAVTAGQIGGQHSSRGCSYIYTAIKGKKKLTGSEKEIAKQLGCSQGMINHAWRRGKEYRGFTITREKVDRSKR